ncbi:UNVERIFIED_ORG: hypothetical protein J2W82_000873 [Pseudomonas mohnii]|nr:hypothetical protein [Pseudomonas mohnii]
MSMSLIVRLLPHPDESLHGFLRRVSEHNLAPSVNALLASFGMKSRLTYSEAELARLADRLHVDVVDLASRQLAPDSENVILRPKYLGRDGVKVCPQCIADNPYHRLGWAHTLVTACPHHDIQLVVRCPACNQGIDADGLLSHCRCGQAYALGPTVAASEESLALSAFLLGVEHPARHSLPPAWRTCSPPADVVDLLYLLGKHFTVKSEDSRENKSSRGKASVGALIVSVQTGFGLLWSWPTRFDEALGARLASTEGPGLAKRLGGWYRELHQRYTDPAYDCLRQALVQHLSLNFDGHLNLRISTIDPQHLQDKCWLSSEEAGRLIGIGSELVRSAVTTGEIKGKVTVKGKNRFVSIHRDVVEKVRQDRLRFLTTTEVRRRLGVSKLVFERLMQSGALDRQTKSQRPPLVSAEFLAADVEALVVRLHQGIQHREVDQSAWTGLQDISIRRGIPDRAICLVLQKILHQEILPVAVIAGVPGISGLRFDLAELKACFEEQQPELLLSITQLARLQGWKHESIKEWIETGLLAARQESVNGKPHWVIPLADLLKFMSEFAVLADLARRTNTRSIWLLNRLKPVGVQPALAPRTGQGTRRGMLLRIDDLVSAAQSSKRAQPSVCTGSA